jgi:hypothetical protein
MSKVLVYLVCGVGLIYMHAIMHILAHSDDTSSDDDSSNTFPRSTGSCRPFKYQGF